ncbi:glycosyltransferase family 4 protein [Candidatus Saganbacteria bacterium]|nr:glycosyltransferase family 4 protein [Candidatus Saganbacteria bacterium]
MPELKKLQPEIELVEFSLPAGRHGGPVIINPSFTRHFILPFYLNSQHLDVVHFPDHILPLIPIRTPKIITVHDLAFVRHPEYYNPGKRWYKQLLAPYSLKRADKIIVVSEFTKRELTQIYQTPEDKITVVPNGIASKFRRKDLDSDSRKRILKRLGFDYDRFILFAATLEPRKNLLSLLDSFEEIARQRSDVGLVICGKKGWLYEESLIRVEVLAKRFKIRYLGYVSDDDLVELYNLAEIFVYPSFYEGFGFPPLEAMACGLPVVTSNVSSLPEIVGDAALTVDPRDPGQIARAILGVLDNKDIAREMVRKGKERAKMFTWQKTAAKTYEVYEDVIKSN